MISPKPPTPRQNKTAEKQRSEQVKEAPPSNKKPSLFKRYNSLPFRAKLYIWITTAGVAWLADSISARIFEQNMIDAEANRRVEMEMRKMKELEFQGRVNSK